MSMNVSRSRTYVTRRVLSASTLRVHMNVAVGLATKAMVSIVHVGVNYPLFCILTVKSIYILLELSIFER